MPVSGARPTTDKVETKWKSAGAAGHQRLQLALGRGGGRRMVAPVERLAGQDPQRLTVHFSRGIDRQPGQGGHLGRLHVGRQGPSQEVAPVRRRGRGMSGGFHESEPPALMLDRHGMSDRIMAQQASLDLAQRHRLPGDLDQSSALPRASNWPFGVQRPMSRER